MPSKSTVSFFSACFILEPDTRKCCLQCRFGGGVAAWETLFSLASREPVRSLTTELTALVGPGAV